MEFSKALKIQMRIHRGKSKSLEHLYVINNVELILPNKGDKISRDGFRQAWQK